MHVQCETFSVSPCSDNLVSNDSFRCSSDGMLVRGLARRTWWFKQTDKRLTVPWLNLLQRNSYNAEMRFLNAVPQVQQRFAGLTKPGAWQKVVSLHADAFWQRHGWKVIAGAAVVGAYFLWCGATH